MREKPGVVLGNLRRVGRMKERTRPDGSEGELWGNLNGTRD